MARQAYQEQLLKLNGELIEMGDLCEEAMSLVMKALREKDEEIAVSVHKIEQKIDQKERDIEAMYDTAASPAAGIRGSEKYLFRTSHDRGYGTDRRSDSRYRRCIQASDRFSAGSAPEDFSYG